MRIYRGNEVRLYRMIMINVERKKKFEHPELLKESGPSDSKSTLKSYGLVSSSDVVTIAVENILLDGEKNEIIQRNIDVITQLLGSANVFFTAYTYNEDKKRELVDIITGIFPNFPAHRILLHETAVGKIAIIRQLMPTLHCDAEFDSANSVANHIKTIFYCSSSEPECELRNNVVSAKCLEDASKKWCTKLKMS